MGNELFDYPFKVEIWGTVSDWVLTVATIITLVFLYKTLKSQTVVQKSQGELLQIEIDRFVKDNKPSFKLEEFYFEHLKKRASIANLIFTFRKKGQLDALDFAVFPDKNFQCEVTSDGPSIKEDSLISVYLYVNNDQLTINSFYSHAFLIYKDRYQNSYRQVLNVFRDSDGKLYPSVSDPAMNENFTIPINA